METKTNLLVANINWNPAKPLTHYDGHFGPNKSSVILFIWDHPVTTNDYHLLFVIIYGSISLVNPTLRI